MKEKLDAMKLHLLLHCYYSAEPVLKLTGKWGNRLLALQNEGLIEWEDRPGEDQTGKVMLPNPTERGIAYIKHLLSVPYPQHKWFIPKKGETP